MSANLEIEVITPNEFASSVEEGFAAVKEEEDSQERSNERGDMLQRLKRKAKGKGKAPLNELVEVSDDEGEEEGKHLPNDPPAARAPASASATAASPEVATPKRRAHEHKAKQKRKRQKRANVVEEEDPVD
ncbi:hypothetical protein UCDDS831_g09273 [Diplodia seriata]|uniref:Uncharacterized protein n=1 Tax=Diplodia seriata TaxID=420778 RepID=A0A0G2FMH1_9PEZI|nr:hypothetical protein UCDDS831_g09273 [Diplodia seriata]